MKKVTMFIMKSCPYCKQALKWMETLQAEEPRYKDIQIAIIDENLQPDLAKQFNYYYVPTYYVDNTKVHEGAATKAIVQSVLEKALD